MLEPGWGTIWCNQNVCRVVASDVAPIPQRGESGRSHSLVRRGGPRQDTMRCQPGVY